MSTLKKRSRYSSTNSTHRKSRVISPELVYEYALRCAILAFMEQQTEKPSPSSKNISPSNSTKKKEEKHSSLHYSLSSLTDKFSDKSDKLTRDITKSLIKRLDDIIKGKDTSKVEYLDKRFRTASEKIKKHLQQERKYRKSSSTINDIVIMFLKTSEEELKKSNNTNPALWYDDLNRFLAKFVDLVIQTLQKDAPSYAKPELIEHLSNFCTPKKSLNSIPTTPSNSNSELLQFQMVITIKNLFQKDQQEIQDKVSELLSICTESVRLKEQ